MKFSFAFIIFISALFYHCTAQKNVQIIEPSNYRLVTNFTVKNNFSKTQFIKNDVNLKNFYATLEKKYLKSPPRIMVDYSKNNVAIIPQNHINSYNIDSVSGNETMYQLHLSLIKNIKVENDSSNLLMMIVPKNIKNVKVIIKK